MPGEIAQKLELIEVKNVGFYVEEKGLDKEGGVVYL